MENSNDKSKTEKFAPMNKNPKPEINRIEGDAYSEARRTPEYDFNDGEDNSNGKLVMISVLLAILLVMVIVLSIILMGSTKKETPEEDVPPVEIEEIIDEEETEEEESKEKITDYSIVFYGESIIKNGEYIVIDADLFDNQMTKVQTRKIKISPETRIISSGKSITRNSLVYLIESVVDEKIVFEGTIQEKDGLALKLSFEYEAEVVPEGEPEEEIPNEPTEENPVQEPTEENPPAEPSVDDPTINAPVENQDTAAE